MESEVVRYVVAIDFGTCGTGFAWCVKDASFLDGGINFNTQWFGNQNGVIKCDSWLETDSKGALLSCGRVAKTKCLNGDARASFFHQRMKMDLYDSQSNKDGGFIDDLAHTWEGKPKRQINNHYFASLELITNFLKEIKKKAMEVVKANESEIQWVITIPAGAEAKHKNWMRGVVLQAGLIDEFNSERLLIALESEAALLSIYKRETPLVKNLHIDQVPSEWQSILKIVQQPHIKLVVDAGGGTIDVVAFKCSPNAGFAEIATARAANAGATYLDAKTYAFLCDNVFPYGLVYAGDVKPMIARLRDDIDSKKKSYDPEDEEIRFNTRELLDYCNSPKWNGGSMRSGKGSKTFKVDSEVGETIISQKYYEDYICEPVYRDVCVPIQEALRQINDVDNENLPVVAYLVGGFGCSRPLHAFLKRNVDVADLATKGRIVEWFPQKLSSDTERVGAVLEGATLFGDHPDLFSSRISRYTIGVQITVPYCDKYARRKERKFYSPQLKEDCISIFSKFVSVNDSVRVGETKGRVFEVFEGKTEAPIRLFYTENPDALFTDDPGVLPLGDIFQFELKGSANELGRKIIIELKLGETEIEFVVYEKAFPDNRREFRSPKLLNVWSDVN